MLNAAIIGFGGVAQAAHVPAYQALESNGVVRLIAACDIDASRFDGKIEINIGKSDQNLTGNIQYYTDLEEMLGQEDIDIIDICLPTYLHADMTVAMLERGYHVFCEKPMAQNYEQACRMTAASKTTGKSLMIGQCLRFSPSYMFIRRLIDSGELGKPIVAVMRRMSSPPIWGWDNWFMDQSRSGGCLLDLHIHDVDIVRYLFGEPGTISCVAHDVYSGFDIVHSQFMYREMSVLAIGDWSRHGCPFSVDYNISFEKATVVYEDNIVTVYPREGNSYIPELEPDDMYTKEIASFVNDIVRGMPNIINSPESASTTIKLISALRESAQAGGKTVAFGGLSQ